MEDRKGGPLHTWASETGMMASPVCGRRASVKEKSKMWQKDVVRGRNERFYTTPVATPGSKCKDTLEAPKV